MHIYTDKQHTDMKMKQGQKLLFYWQLPAKRIKLFKIPILKSTPLEPRTCTMGLHSNSPLLVYFYVVGL